MDVLKLRTLTKKSVIDFGRFSGMSVHQILSLRHTAYLRYIYYNNSKIDFTEDILKEIYVINGKFDNRIKKPGTDIELCKNLNKKKFDDLVCRKGGNAMRAINQKKIMSKIDAKKSFHKDMVKFSKANMQRINHGH